MKMSVLFFVSEYTGKDLSGELCHDTDTKHTRSCAAILSQRNGTPFTNIG